MCIVEFENVGLLVLMQELHGLHPNLTEVVWGCPVEPANERPNLIDGTTGSGDIRATEACPLMAFKAISPDIFLYPLVLHLSPGWNAEFFTALDAPGFALKSRNQLVEVLDFHWFS
jgi:hypothetical protein